MAYIKDLCKSVNFYRPFIPLYDVKGVYSVLLDAILDRRRVSMLYQSASHINSRQEPRELEPYVLVNNGGDWYVVGMCRETKKIRTFSLNRIEHVEKTEHCFILPDSFNADTYLAEGFGRMTGKTNSKIQLHITPPASAWISASKWHSSQTIKHHTDGSITLTMNCPITDSLVRWVLQLGENVRIHYPKELKNRVWECASALIKNNE
jgi:predicted DNA-binding transcriptional regulator YafY